jgi:thiol:disulfide interchange protein
MRPARSVAPRSTINRSTQLRSRAKSIQLARTPIRKFRQRSSARYREKRILLVFGANWCYDCHVLERALHEGAAGKIVEESFLLVHVDIGEGEKNPELVKTYRIPIEKGVPAVAVLNGDGKLLYSSGDGEFESARTMFKRDLVAFLSRWRVRPSAHS